MHPRRILDGIYWKFRLGRPWRELPSRYGSHEVCYLYYNRWNHSGLLKEISLALIKDVETRGHFDVRKAMKDGLITFEREGSKYNVYISASLVDMWQVSTAMIYYRLVADETGKKLLQPRSRLFNTGIYDGPK